MPILQAISFPRLSSLAVSSLATLFEYDNRAIINCIMNQYRSQITITCYAPSRTRCTCSPCHPPVPASPEKSSSSCNAYKSRTMSRQSYDKAENTHPQAHHQDQRRPRQTYVLLQDSCLHVFRTLARRTLQSVADIVEHELWLRYFIHT